MKLHIVTVGSPKLAYARDGWDEYWQRLGHYHQLRVTHIADKHNDAAHLREAAGKAWLVALDSHGQQFTSPELANWLAQRELAAQEVCLIIGGPDGLPAEITDSAQLVLSFGKLTLPHDLAMVVLLESLYRASTINAHQPYHR